MFILMNDLIFLSKKQNYILSLSQILSDFILDNPSDVINKIGYTSQYCSRNDGVENLCTS